MPGYWQPIAARLPSFIDFEPIYGLNSSVSQNGKNCQKCHPSEAQATPPAGGGGSSNSLQQQTNHGWRLDSIVCSCVRRQVHHKRRLLLGTPKNFVCERLDVSFSSVFAISSTPRG